MLKYLEYTIKSGKTVLEHGVKTSAQLEDIVRPYVASNQPVSIAMQLITEEDGNKLIASWGGLHVEPQKAA